MIPDLSPKGLGRIFDDALALYRANAVPILAVAAIVVFPLALANGIAQSFYTRGLLALLPVISGGEIPSAELGRLQAFSAAGNAVIPFYLAGRLFLAVCLYVSAPALLYGVRVGRRDLVRGGWSRALPVLGVYAAYVAGAGMLAIVGALVTFFLLGLPGLIFAGYVALRFALAPVVSAAEGAGFERSFRRSWELTAGRVRRTLGFVLLLGLLSSLLQAAVGSLGAIRQLVESVQRPEAVFEQLSVGWKVAEGLLSAASITVVLPFVFLSWYVFYVDLRARREGMDLLVRAQALASPEDAMGGPPKERQRTTLGSGAVTLALVAALTLCAATFARPAAASPALASPALAEEQPSSLADYRSRVTEASLLMEERRSDIADEIAALEVATGVGALLPASEEIRLGDVVVEVDNSVLNSLVVRLDSADSELERERAADDIALHLSSLARSLDPAAGSRVPQDPQALRELLERHRVAGRSAFSDWFGQLVERAQEWLSDRLRGVSIAGMPPGVTTAVIVVLVSILAAALAWVATIAIRAGRGAFARDEGTSPLVPPPPVPTQPEDEPADPLSAADALARSGRHREAVRVLFKGAVRFLASRGAIADARARTTSELVAEVKSRAPVSARPIADLAGGFEVAWYGHVDPEPEGYAFARAAFEALAPAGGALAASDHPADDLSASDPPSGDPSASDPSASHPAGESRGPRSSR